VAQGGEAAQVPAEDAVGAADGVLQLRLGARLPGLAPRLPVVGVDPLVGTGRALRPGALAGVLEPAGARVLEDPLGRDLPDDLGDGLGQGPEALLADLGLG